MEAIFGITHHVNLLQECSRAFVIFFYGLGMLRLSGRRTFARMSALDLVITVVVGSVMAQSMTGAVPMLPAMAGIAILIFLHWIVGHLIARSEILSRVIEGAEIALIRDGIIDDAARLRSKISLSDISEALRAHGLDGLRDIGNVKKLALEHNGKLSVVKRDA